MSFIDTTNNRRIMVIGTFAIIDTEIDGAHAGRFFGELQNEINVLK